jgi:hypothetical protein
MKPNRTVPRNRSRRRINYKQKLQRSRLAKQPPIRRHQRQIITSAGVVRIMRFRRHLSPLLHKTPPRCTPQPCSNPNILHSNQLTHKSKRLVHRYFLSSPQVKREIGSGKREPFFFFFKVIYIYIYYLLVIFIILLFI